MGDIMENKLLINVYIPTMEKDYDLFIPINKKVGIVKQLIINSIVDLTYGIYKPNDKLELYIRSNGKKLDNSAFVKESNISNGEKLILY